MLISFFSFFYVSYLIILIRCYYLFSHIATHNIGFGYFMVIMGFVLVYGVIYRAEQLANLLKNINKTVGIFNNKANVYYREMAWLPFQKTSLCRRTKLI